MDSCLSIDHVVNDRWRTDPSAVDCFVFPGHDPSHCAALVDRVQDQVFEISVDRIWFDIRWMYHRTRSGFSHRVRPPQSFQISTELIRYQTHVGAICIETNSLE